MLCGADEKNYIEKLLIVMMMDCLLSYFFSSIHRNYWSCVTPTVCFHFVLSSIRCHQLYMIAFRSSTHHLPITCNDHKPGGMQARGLCYCSLLLFCFWTKFWCFMRSWISSILPNSHMLLSSTSLHSFLIIFVSVYVYIMFSFSS